MRNLPNKHLEFLDGLRGLAALYVVLHHVYMEVCWKNPGKMLPPLATHLTNWLLYGHYAVSVFIILSGFCLTLPIMQSENHQLRGGVRGFFKRRIRRIVPPYYAALAVTLVMIALVPGLRHRTGTRWDISLPVPDHGLPLSSLIPFTKSVLLAHLLLLQNLRLSWINAIDYPMWSVSTEWEIYFLFPFLLLPIWRRFGLTALVGTAFLVGTGLQFARHGRFEYACPWYIGLFAMGMAGGVLGFSSEDYIVRWRKRFPWGSVAVGLTLTFLALIDFEAIWSWGHPWVLDAVVGAAVTCLLVSGCLRLHDGDSGLVMNILNTRGLVGIGIFSYSLYLIHAPLLALVHMLLPPRLSLTAQFLSLLLLGLPLCILLSYGFHLIFERPFLRDRKKERLPELMRDVASIPAP